MIPHIEKFIHQKIERQPFADEAKEHSSEAINQKALDEHKRIVDTIRGSLNALRIGNPQMYKVFEDHMKMLYGSCHLLARRTPIEYVGSKIDPQYYALVKAYADGQLEILDSLFSMLEWKLEIPLKEKRKSVLDKIKELLYLRR